nr:hypothetical protein [Gemmatimonadaceae bacterium]
MSRLLACTLLASGLLAAPGALLAQRGTHVPTIDELLALRSVGSPQLSPDGRRIAWLETRTDWGRDQFTSQLWLADSAGAVPRQLTRHEQGVSQPLWSPDGKWIAVTSTRVGGKAQLFAIPVDGGEAVQLTNHPVGVIGFRWSPTGDRIAFTATAADPERTRRDSTYGAFEVVRRDYAWPQLWTIELAPALAAPQGGTMRTRGTQRAVGGFEWSPDGTRIAFAATRAPDLAFAETSDLFVDSVRAVVTQPGPEGTPTWSPDGTRLVFASAMGATERNYARTLRLATVSAEGGAVTPVPTTFDEQASVIGWTTAGIWFAALERTASHLFRVDPASGAVTR